MAIPTSTDATIQLKDEVAANADAVAVFLHKQTKPGSEPVSALPEELRSIALERELVVSDIGVYPYLNADQCEQIYNEIAVALLDFMFERPAAKDVLRGRTFVRALH